MNRSANARNRSGRVSPTKYPFTRTFGKDIAKSSQEITVVGLRQIVNGNRRVASHGPEHFFPHRMTSVWHGLHSAFAGPILGVRLGDEIGTHRVEKHVCDLNSIGVLVPQSFNKINTVLIAGHSSPRAAHHGHRRGPRPALVFAFSETAILRNDRSNRAPRENGSARALESDFAETDSKIALDVPLSSRAHPVEASSIERRSSKPIVHRMRKPQSRVHLGNRNGITLTKSRAIPGPNVSMMRSKSRHDVAKSFETVGVRAECNGRLALNENKTYMCSYKPDPSVANQFAQIAYVWTQPSLHLAGLTLGRTVNGRRPRAETPRRGPAHLGAARPALLPRLVGRRRRGGRRAGDVRGLRSLLRENYRDRLRGGGRARAAALEGLALRRRALQTQAPADRLQFMASAGGHPKMYTRFLEDDESRNDLAMTWPWASHSASASGAQTWRIADRFN